MQITSHQTVNIKGLVPGKEIEQIFIEMKGRKIKKKTKDKGISSGCLEPDTHLPLRILPLPHLPTSCLFLEAVLHENKVLFYFLWKSWCGFDDFLYLEGSFPI